MQRIHTWAQSHFAALRADEEGQTMAEYGVVLAVITLAVIGAFMLLGDAIFDKISSVTSILTGG